MHTANDIYVLCIAFEIREDFLSKKRDTLLSQVGYLIKNK